MVKLKILVPDGTVNYIKNPAFRYDTTDWNTVGATLTRTLTRARFGMASGKVVTAGAALHEGVYFRVSALDGISDSVTVSVYVRGEGKVRIRLDDNDIGGAEYASQPVQLTDERWTRIQVTGMNSGGDDLRLYVETDEGSAKVRTFYVDGAQMERKPYATTYVDGDQENCRWNGLYHNSTSERPASTRAGGRWVELMGEEREAEDLYMTVAGGLGMAPLSNNVQSYALEAGGYHQNAKVNMRPITLTFHAKHRVDDRFDPVSLEFLHELRQMLIDVVKPDLTGGDEDIWFEYTDGAIPLYFRARYDGGLEGEWDVRNAYVNSFPLRLLAVSPFLEEDSQEAQTLDFQESLTIGNVAARINGRWSNLNYGVNKVLNYSNLTRGPRGHIYAGGNGNMTIGNNDVMAVDPLIPLNNLGIWDGEKWSSLGLPSGAGIVIYDIAVAPNGDVYVTGDFTTIGGVAANRIARWDGSTWNALGSGLNSYGWSISIAPNGDLYVGGNFTTAGGKASQLARWDGSTWHVIGPVSEIVYAVVVSKDGSTLYYATSDNVYEYDLGTNVSVQMGATFNSSPILVLRISPSGVLYAGGPFYLGSTSTEEAGIARWNGSAWESLGDTRLHTDNPNVYLVPVNITDIGFLPDGRLIAVGQFLWSGSALPFEGLMIYNGSTWTRLDALFNLSTTTYLGSCLVTPDGTIYVGAQGSTTDSVTGLRCSGITTVNNPGSTETIPRVYVNGPGTLLWLENQTNARTAYFYLKVLDGEEVVIDFGLGTIWSEIRGNISNAILPGSDFHSFALAPGDNELACFMVDDVNAEMSIQFQPRHWSADATGRGDEL